MNLLLFNSDGSVKFSAFPEMIMRGDDNVYHVHCAIEGYSNEDYVATAILTLPDKETANPLVGLPCSIVHDGTQYSGYRFTLSQAETAYVGDVKLAIRLTSQNPERKFTYGKVLTVNRSTVEPNVARITMAQYENLVESLASFQPKFSATNFRAYPTLSAAHSDVANLALGQYAFVAGTLSVYVKTLAGLQLVASFATA